MADLITLTPEGLYCPLGDFHIDPWRPVERALITHAHSDHARRGTNHYHAPRSAVGLLRQRLGPEATIDGHGFDEPLALGDATASFHPAGHVLGSAQIRIEAAGEVWVVSGDYKRDPDPSCEAFEVVPCDAFVTEATFALPLLRPTMARFAPRAASASAAAKPMPLVAPVIRICLSFTAQQSKRYGNARMI